MFKLFDQEGGFWTLVNFIGDIFLLSLCWLVCSLPIVTAGAATTALYDATVHSFRFKEGGTFARFFRTFKNEFRLATLSWLMWLVIWATCFYMLSFAAGIDSMYLTVGLVIMLLPTGISCWVFPILSRFTYDFSSLNKTALAFAGTHIIATLIIALSTLVAVYLCAWLWLPALFLPALLMLFWSLFMEKTFIKYMKSDDDKTVE